MPSKPISGLNAGNPAQNGDLIPCDRSGANFKITAASIAALAAGAASDPGVLHQWGGSRSQFGNQLASGFGLSNAASSTWNEPTATEPVEVNIVSKTFGSDFTYISDTGSPTYAFSVGSVRDYQTRVKTLFSTTVRYWFGFAFEANFASQDMNHNIPTVPAVAFRYSSDAGDANWKCVTFDGGTSHVVDSGVAIDTSVSHVFRIATEDGGVTFKFYIDGNQVASMSADLPAASVTMNPVVWMDNATTTNAVQMNVAYCLYHTL